MELRVDVLEPSASYCVERFHLRDNALLVRELIWGSDYPVSRRYMTYDIAFGRRRGPGVRRRRSGRSFGRQSFEAPGATRGSCR